MIALLSIVNIENDSDFVTELNVDDNVVDDIGDDNVNVAVDDDTGGIDDEYDDDDEINVFIAIS